MSREALRAFIQDALPYPEKCYRGIRAKHKGDDDAEFGMCLKSVGILPGNTLDEKGKLRLSTLDPVVGMLAAFENYSVWDDVSGDDSRVCFQS